jgi:hypothetical protein
MRSKNMYPTNPCQKRRMFDKNTREIVKNTPIPVINSISHCQKARYRCQKHPKNVSITLFDVKNKGCSVKGSLLTTARHHFRNPVFRSP